VFTSLSAATVTWRVMVDVVYSNVVAGQRRRLLQVDAPGSPSFIRAEKNQSIAPREVDLNIYLQREGKTMDSSSSSDEKEQDHTMVYVLAAVSVTAIFAALYVLNVLKNMKQATLQTQLQMSVSSPKQMV
jgi:hypothetical protein